MYGVSTSNVARAPQRSVTYRVERLRKVDRRDPHFDTPLSASSVLATCTSLDDPVFEMSDVILPGPVGVSCQAFL